MRIRFVVAIAMACVALAAMTASAGTPPAAATAPAAKPSAPTLAFVDAQGRAISTGQFMAAVKAGQRYTANKQADRFIMHLLAPGAHPPGSLTWADLTRKSTSFVMLSINGHHYKVVFHDEHGQVIQQDAFAAGAAKDQRYMQRLDAERGEAILTLLPIGQNPPGSKPTSDWSQASPLDAGSAPKPGTQLAAFDLPKVGGGRIGSAQLKGKPYVIDFFFADCVGCIAELPVLNAYHAKHPEQAVFALTFDDARIAADFIQQRHFNWPVAYSGKSFTDKLGIKVYPTMVVIGADGKVLATRVGADDSVTAETLAQWVSDSIHHPRPASRTH